jgi:predicted ribosomally synthesized peptide with SipW-like signal peptide
MDKKKVLVSLVTMGAAAALLVGATFAYFSAKDTSTGNTFGTGILKISITGQNSDSGFQNQSLGTNWQPGETRLVNFDVKNTGSLPVNLRGFATGTWGYTSLDSQNMVKVTKVEAWNGAGWTTLVDSAPGITGYFYYSPNGTDASLYEVAAGGRAQLQLSVTLDSSAGDGFQGQTFTATLQVEGKQTNATTWP